MPARLKASLNSSYGGGGRERGRKEKEEEEVEELGYS